MSICVFESQFSYLPTNALHTAHPCVWLVARPCRRKWTGGDCVSFFFGFRFWLLNKWARWIVYSCVQNDTRDTCISIHLILVYFSMIFGVWHSMDLQPFIKYAGFFFTAVEVATPIIIIERSWWAWLNVDIIGQLNAMFSVSLSSSYFCFLLCFASAVEPYAVFWHWFSATAAGTNWIESNNWLQGRRLC